MQDSGLNRYLSRRAGFQGVRDVCRWFGAEGGKRDQAEVFDVLFEGGLIVFYRKKVIRLLFFNDIACRVFLGMQGITGYDPFGVAHGGMVFDV